MSNLKERLKELADKTVQRIGEHPDADLVREAITEIERLETLTAEPKKDSKK